MNKKFTFNDFLAALESNFREYTQKEITDETYSEGFFNDFLKSLIEPVDNGGVEIAPQNPTEKNKILVINQRNNEPVCSIFNHDFTQCDFIIINTVLNIVMLCVSILFFRKK